jgi:uncharacterized membrane protein YeaQ/YmgE (transglycosylase-associated protein family)
MDAQTVVLTLIVGIVAGAVAGFLRKGSGYGIIGDAIIGFLGAVVANWLCSRFGFSFGQSQIVELFLRSVLGSMLLLSVIGLFTRSNV